MANTDRPNGFKPVGTIDGSPWSSTVRTYEVDSSNATAIFLGDMIALEADGNVTPAAAGSTQLLGACVGIEHSDPGDNTSRTLQGGGTYDLNLSKKSLAASTAGRIYVTASPDVLYEVQEDGDTSDLALTSIGANVDHIAGAGSATTGVSGHELDSSSLTAAGSAGFRIVDFVRREDNEIGDWARWLVKVHEHHFAATNGV